MVEIVDLDEHLVPAYLCCLEDWSVDMQDAGEHKACWYRQKKTQGLRVKMACVDGVACGMIQYLPIEHSHVAGSGLYFIYCIWVHGHRQGVGNRQRHGLGTALLAAAEADARALGASGMAAWGLILPFWMRAAWFAKHGYRAVARDGISQLLWKPFVPEATPPRWNTQQKSPALTPGKVTVTALVNGWCPAQNITFERAKRASAALGDKVDFQEINTLDRQVFEEWGILDGLFINNKQVNTGPPPSYEKIFALIEKQVRRLK